MNLDQTREILSYYSILRMGDFTIPRYDEIGESELDFQEWQMREI